MLLKRDRNLAVHLTLAGVYAIPLIVRQQSTNNVCWGNDWLFGVG